MIKDLRKIHPCTKGGTFVVKKIPGNMIRPDTSTDRKRTSKGAADLSEIFLEISYNPRVNAENILRVIHVKKKKKNVKIAINRINRKSDYC